MMEDRIIRLIAKKVSCEASPAELEELNNHVLVNPESVFYIELVSQLWKEEKIAFDSDTESDYLKHILKYQPQFEVQDDADLDGLAVCEAPTKIKTLTWPASKFTLVFLILFIAIASCIIYLLPSHSSRIIAIVSKKNKSVEWIVSKGSRKIITLPDSTKVWLNAGSKISYDSGAYNKNNRTVCLSGEAFFDVVKNKEKPFIINTNKISIKVLGTAFNVKAYPGEKSTETTLLRGSIELTVNNKPYQKILLKPNEKFMLVDSLSEEVGNKTTLVPQNNSSNTVKSRLVIQQVQPVLVANKQYLEETSWINDNLVFQNESLEDLVPKMERWFNVDIEINNESLKSLHFTGVFHKETIDEALTAMQLIKPFTYKINQGHVQIN